MKRGFFWLLFAGFILANGAVLVSSPPVAADPVYLDCFYTPQSMGCTNGIVDRCIDGQSVEESCGKLQ